MSGQGEKIPMQARSRKTRDKIVRALEVLLKEKAFEDISVASLATQAGVSVGAVYRRFENKDALIPVVLDVYRARIEAFAAAPESRFVTDPTTGLLINLKRMAELSWRFLEQDGHLLRAAFIYARTRPDVVGATWDDFLEESAAGYKEFLSLFKDEIARPNLEEAARMSLYLLNTGVAEYGLYPTHGPGTVIKMAPDQFTNAIAQAVYGYLTAPEIGSEDR